MPGSDGVVITLITVELELMAAISWGRLTAGGTCIPIAASLDTSSTELSLETATRSFCLSPDVSLHTAFRSSTCASNSLWTQKCVMRQIFYDLSLGTSSCLFTREIPLHCCLTNQVLRWILTSRPWTRFARPRCARPAGPVETRSLRVNHSVSPVGNSAVWKTSHYV